jgi:hypothetical protein
MIYSWSLHEKIEDTLNMGIKAQNPKNLIEVRPDIVLISNYTYDIEIYDSIKYLEKKRN